MVSECDPSSEMCSDYTNVQCNYKKWVCDSRNGQCNLQIWAVQPTEMGRVTTKMGKVAIAKGSVTSEMGSKTYRNG